MELLFSCNHFSEKNSIDLMSDEDSLSVLPFGSLSYHSVSNGQMVLGSPSSLKLQQLPHLQLLGQWT